MNLLLGILISVVIVLVWLKSGSPKRPPLPPGPRADPLIGHLRIIPYAGLESFFYEMGKLYGDVLYFNILGRNVIVLNSVQAAVDLLEKRSANYSDRPKLWFFQLMGFVKSLPTMEYNDSFRLHRKMYQQFFGKNQCLSFHPSHTTDARVLAQNLQSDFRRREYFLIRFATTIITRATYGHKIVSDDDPYLRIAEDLCAMVENAGPIGGTAIDAFPILRHFPSWFPGTYYARYARDQQPLVVRQHTYPYAQVIKHMAEKTAKPSFMVTQLEKLIREGSNIEDMIGHIQGASATTFMAGAETTSSTLSFFLLAMALHPECQAQAQKEIDRVIGSDRLPEFSDRPSLPYVECIVQEVFRWIPVAPLGAPHRSVKDDIYKGMFIPSGSIVIANTRAMTLDESVYNNPFGFDPSRFLPKPAGRGEPWPVGQFGFGRRICPGRHFANDSVWVSIATILSTLSISKVAGHPINDPGLGLHTISGTTCHPKPFECSIEHRSEKAMSLLAQTDLSDS